MPRIVTKTYMAKMLTSSDSRDGKVTSSSTFMATPSFHSAAAPNTPIRKHVWTAGLDSRTEEVTLLEVSYTVTHLPQMFPKITIPPSERQVDVGDEKARSDPCRVTRRRVCGIHTSPTILPLYVAGSGYPT